MPHDNEHARSFSAASAHRDEIMTKEIMTKEIMTKEM
jgi:hypothetical protein